MDSWCEWHRKIVRYIEAVQNHHYSQEISISLVMKWLPQYENNAVVPAGAFAKYFKNGAPGPVEISNLIASIKAGGTIGVDIDPAAIPRTVLNLKAVALSVVLPPSEEKNWRFQADLIPPTRDVRIHRRIITLSNFPERPDWSADKPYQNIDPRSTWLMNSLPTLIKYGATIDESSLNRNTWPILDLILHLK